MIRNGKILDVKAYTDFVASHPDRPAEYRTYYDWYLAEEEKCEERQLTLEDAK